jgi:hypothetical protein
LCIFPKFLSRVPLHNDLCPLCRRFQVDSSNTSRQRNSLRSRNSWRIRGDIRPLGGDLMIWGTSYISYLHW